ncbi:MAG: CAAX prenyl protease-related protein [Pseudomonadota bacterium]
MNSTVAMLVRRREALPRILPFAVYIAFLVAAPTLREALPSGWDGRWLYAMQIAAVLLVLAWLSSAYRELRPLALGWRDALEATAVGIAVFIAWITLDLPWAMFDEPGAGFDPRTARGEIEWSLAAVRVFGAAAVVPIMEELFWRSFILRWIDKSDFLQLPAAAASGRALAISALLFGLEHNLWLAGIFAGLAYGGLYLRSNTLWSPILAHAVTNLLLGFWVIATESWSFW